MAFCSWEARCAEVQQEETHSDTTNTCGCLEFSQVNQGAEPEAQLECWPCQDEVVEEEVVTTSAGGASTQCRGIDCAEGFLVSGAGAIRCRLVQTRGLLRQENKSVNTLFHRKRILH